MKNHFKMIKTEPMDHIPIYKYENEDNKEQLKVAKYHLNVYTFDRKWW
jgi:hypothetical protein